MRSKFATILAGLVLLGAAAPGAAERIDRVLAVVGGQIITESDVRAAQSFGLVAPARSGADPIRRSLDQLIRRELILGELSRSSTVEPATAEVDRRMAAIRAGFTSESAYESKLRETAMTEARLRDIVEADIRVDDYLGQRFGAVAEPADEEVAAYYETHRAEFMSGGRQLTLDQAKATARERLIDERRAQIVDDWIARLRRRAEVSDLYFADSK